jgi:hypothetical protein
MVREIADSLKTLSQLKDKLNFTLDEANQLVLEVQRTLERLNITFRASVTVSRTEIAARTTEEIDLAYTRICGKFRIAVVRERVTEGDGGNISVTTLQETPWLEARQRVKAETFPKLPELLRKLIKNVEEAIELVRNTIPSVESALDSMKQ